MKTLIIVAHPELKDSTTQQFLHASLGGLDKVTWHVLNPQMHFDVKAEQRLLMQHQRIIFQFPLYWYSAPAILKQWQDDVLTRAFVYPEEDGKLVDKDLGIVTTLGNPERQYQPGALENYPLADLLLPYQALAHRTQMRYLTPLIVDQFSYMTAQQKAALLVRYRQFVTMDNVNSFNSRQTFLIDQLKHLKVTDDQTQMMIKLITEQIVHNQEHLTDLKDQIKLIKRQEE